MYFTEDFVDDIADLQHGQASSWKKESYHSVVCFVLDDGS